MSAPYSAPRRLERSRSDRFIGGVCGGIAKYLNMDPTLVRILTVVITLFTFVPVVAYIIAMFVMPEEPAEGSGEYPRVGSTGSNLGYPGNGYQATDPVWGSAGAPWEQPQANQTPAPHPTAQKPTVQDPASQQPTTADSPSSPFGDTGTQR